MPLNATFNKETKIVAKITNLNGHLTTTSPLTIKNQLREYQINSIEDLPDVSEVSVVNGATIVRNASTGLYEVKPLSADFIDGAIDAGEF
jgi:hypothetical protein